jgi:hypothetical protein
MILFFHGSAGSASFRENVYQRSRCVESVALNIEQPELRRQGKTFTVVPQAMGEREGFSPCDVETVPAVG